MSSRLRKRFGVGIAPLAGAAAGDADLKISQVAADAVREPSSGRATIIVRVQTAGGLIGIGEIAASPDVPAALANVARIRPKLLGLDALSAVVVDEALAGEPARGGVNIALLDILGKRTVAPLYEALGGPTRGKVRALAVLSKPTPAEVRRAHAAGHRAFSIPIQMPEGPARGREFYDRVQRTMESPPRSRRRGFRLRSRLRRPN